MVFLMSSVVLALAAEFKACRPTCRIMTAPMITAIYVTLASFAPVAASISLWEISAKLTPAAERTAPRTISTARRG